MSDTLTSSPRPAASSSTGIDQCQSFEELQEKYNFLNFSSYGRVLTNLILGQIHTFGPGARVLDVGCGKGIGRQVNLQHEVRAAAGEFWGLEPDEGIVPENGLFDNFQYALMETAELPPASFDLAYSSMVMEHVADPAGFLGALNRCLKPGGVYLFVTPNAKSFVPRMTKFCHDFRIDETVLRLVQGSKQVEEYHYPVQFKFNTETLIDRYAAEAGFRKPEYVYIEGSGSSSYFRGPLRLVYKMLVAKRQLIKQPTRLSTMICRLTNAD